MNRSDRILSLYEQWLSSEIQATKHVEYRQGLMQAYDILKIVKKGEGSHDT